MSDKQSPFAGLDKALLRSTKPQESPARPADAEDTPAASTGDRAAAEPGGEAPAPKRPRTRKVGGAAAGSAEETADALLEQVSATSDASNQASMLASFDASLIASVRKAVRTPGKEVSFVRLTSEEKRELADIVYSYKRQGKKTSENEINRIAINCLLEDHRRHGDASLLARIIEALLA